MGFRNIVAATYWAEIYRKVKSMIIKLPSYMADVTVAKLDSLITSVMLVIGCGIAGALAAPRLARDPQHQVPFITRASDPRESNTRYAQGCIVVRGPDDSAELCMADILVAGFDHLPTSLPRSADGLPAPRLPRRVCF